MLDVIRQAARRGVPIRRQQRHRLAADCFQGQRHILLNLARPGEVAALHFLQHGAYVLFAEGRLPGQEAIQSRAEAIDVAGGAELIVPAGRLLGAHVLRRAQRGAHHGLRRGADRVRDQRAFARLRPQGRLQRLAHRLGQTPVNHQCLAVFAEHDVARLQIPVQHATAMSIGDRIADIDESPQQRAQRQCALPGVHAGGVRFVKALDRVLETVAADETHGVIGPAVAVGA